MNYYLKIDGLFKEVSIEEYCNAESDAGFHNKLDVKDPNYKTTPATSSFSGSNISGTQSKDKLYSLGFNSLSDASIFYTKISDYDEEAEIIALEGKTVVYWKNHKVRSLEELIIDTGLLSSSRMGMIELILKQDESTEDITRLADELIDFYQNQHVEFKTVEDFVRMRFILKTLTVLLEKRIDKVMRN